MNTESRFSDLKLQRGPTLNVNPHSLHFHDEVDLHGKGKEQENHYYGNRDISETVVREGQKTRVVQTQIELCGETQEQGDEHREAHF